jgi:hypothetical protein
MSIEGIIQEVRGEISRLQQVVELLSGTVSVQRKTKVRAKRRGISAAGRKRIAAAQRARWAKIRAAKK